MLVSECMRRDPLTVKKDDSFRYALKLIRKEGIRHLPVVDGRRVAGIVTDRDLRQSGPSTASTLEVHELNYLLEHLTIQDIMTTDVITVTPESDLLDAARLLLTHKIGCLPVVEREHLVGIITRSDMIRALVELHGRLQAASAVELVVEDRPGAFEAVMTAAGGGSATILSGAVVRQGERRPVLLVRTTESALGELRRRLTTAGHPPLTA
jgi:acetoin utilization protein AcuB